MSIKITKDFVKKLPKTELHVHLDGSLRIDTIFDLAKKYNVKLPRKSKEKLKDLICCDKKCESLEDYLRGFEVTLSVLQHTNALDRAAYELAEDAAKENIKYMEVRFSPILHTRKGSKLTDICDAVLNGLRKAEKKYDILTGVIICGIRNMDPATSLKLAELAVAYKHKGVIGFDLAGAEYNHPAKDHAEACDLVKKNHLNITIHAGEAYGPLSIEQALHSCNAHRIGHGTHLIEDGDLLNFMNDHRIPIEICLTSNLHTKAVERIESHPVQLFIDYGLRVTLNTDNRLISNTTLTDEFMLLLDKFDVDYMDIKNIIINGFKSAFLPYRHRVRLINQALNDMEKLEETELKNKIKIEEKI